MSKWVSEIRRDSHTMYVKTESGYWKANNLSWAWRWGEVQQILIWHHVPTWPMTHTLDQLEWKYDMLIDKYGWMFNDPLSWRRSDLGDRIIEMPLK